MSEPFSDVSDARNRNMLLQYIDVRCRTIVMGMSAKKMKSKKSACIVREIIMLGLTKCSQRIKGNEDQSRKEPVKR